jgi:hypothetical protein
VKYKFSNDGSVTGNGNLTGYNPAAALDPGAIANVMREVADGRTIRPKIMSLVTADNQFWSVLMINRAVNGAFGNVWVCGGKIQVVASNQKAVLEALSPAGAGIVIGRH